MKSYLKNFKLLCANKKINFTVLPTQNYLELVSNTARFLKKKLLKTYE